MRALRQFLAEHDPRILMAMHLALVLLIANLSSAPWYIVVGGGVFALVSYFGIYAAAYYTVHRR